MCGHVLGKTFLTKSDAEREPLGGAHPREALELFAAQIAGDTGYWLNRPLCRPRAKSLLPPLLLDALPRAILTCHLYRALHLRLLGTLGIGGQRGTIPVDEAANGVLVTRVPLSLLNLSRGKTIRATGVIGACAAVAGKVKL